MKDIKCPICRKYLFTQKTEYKTCCLCRNCGRFIEYDPKTTNTAIKDRPPRLTSSGMRIW